MNANNTSTAAALSPSTASAPALAAPKTPRELLASFGQRVQDRDLDSLLALYELDAVFVPQPGVVLRGVPAIREALAGMLALSPTMETRVLEVHESGETALAIVDWTLRGTGPDGSPVTQGGRSADVLRRQADGSWRVLIDHPRSD